MQEWWITVGLTLVGMAAGSGVSVLITGRFIGRYEATMESHDERIGKLEASDDESASQAELAAFRLEMNGRLANKVHVKELENVNRRLDDMQRGFSEMRGETREDMNEMRVGLKELNDSIVRALALRGSGPAGV